MIKSWRALWTIGGLVVLCVTLVLVGAWAVVARQKAPAMSDLMMNMPAGHVHMMEQTQSSGGFFSDFLKIYTPRRVCMFYETPLIWLHLVSDLLIAASYYSIPIALIVFVRRRKDLAFGWVFWLFAGFILACGTTHVFGVIDLWQPYYRVDGIIKFATAILSVVTAAALWPLLPKALALPSRSELESAVADRTDELRRSNDSLRRSEERYRLVNRATNDAIWDWDLLTDELRWNESLEVVFGHRLADVPQTVAWRHDHINPEDRDRMVTNIRAVIDGGADTWNDEYRFRRGDGTYASVVDRGHVSRDESGRAIRMVGSILDQTERQNAAAERERLLAGERKARADAENANRLKDEFLATLSHELRTPLNAILGWSQIMRRRKGEDPDIIEGLAVIERNARAQAELIDDLLDMSRIISGKMRLEVQRLNIADVINAALASAKPAADAKEVRIEQVLDTQVAPMRGDPARLQQVVWNLLANAIKFTPKGGKVQVALERINSHVEITVSDNGSGIAPDFLPHVFDRFRQADGTTTRTHGGLGLGLSIAKSIVEAHGGRMRAKSPGEGQGSTFTVELPLAVVHDDSPGEPRQHPDRPLAAPDAELICEDRLLEDVHVLVVDDEADARELVRRVLVACHARVTTVSSVVEALAMFKSERPTVLISDIGMPQRDGYELIRELRKLPAAEGGDTPAIAMTAFAHSDDRRRALLAGYQSHIAKPVEPAELIAVVASLAGKFGRKG